MVLNGTDSDVEVIEEEAAFYTALAAVSAQFTDVFKERVRGSNSLAKGKSCDDCGRDFIISYVLDSSTVLHVIISEFNIS
jgi:hypothetical protein